MIRVVIVDDQPLVRAGLRTILEAESDIEIVAESGSVDEACAALASLAVDVMLLDIEMPGCSGIEGIERVSRVQPDLRIVMLTMFDLDEYVADALREGAIGFVLKTAPHDLLVSSVRQAAAGNRVFSPEVLDRMVNSFSRGVGRDAQPARDFSGELTEREFDVFREVARGKANAEIGAELSLSEATVKTYVTRILAKLGLRNRVEAAILAHECGIVGPEDMRPRDGDWQRQ